ncbi:NUDIX domain-containing protein [Nocardia sp. NPDC051832]|uniref:NUDIX domain-containing protein n=1 Tax=Nocardia sp. NPDC051832 TaxID=3155673 RepID=UPI0034456B4D
MRPEALERIERDLRATARAEGITDFVVGVAVFRDRKLLVVRRVPDSYYGGMYELPGGGVESGESFTECVERELHEETGLRVRGFLEFLGAVDYATRTKAKVRKFSFIVETEPGRVELAPGEHDAHAWIDAGALEVLPFTPDTRETIRALVDSLDQPHPA